MEIAVCMKQVPAVSEGNMDRETGVLIRTGLEAVVNPGDLSALEAALQLKEQTGAHITVFTMGPEKAAEVLRTAYSMGADQGWLLCDRAFAGADVLATSYTLMQAIHSTGRYDLILCGKQTTDGDTAQVSGALAKWLELPHLNWVTKIQVAETQQIIAEYKMEQRSITAQVKLPCLLSVETAAFQPRMPSLKLKLQAKKADIKVLTCKDFLDSQEHHYGLSGSATCVKQIFPPEQTKKRKPVSMGKIDTARYIKKILENAGQEVNNE